MSEIQLFFYDHDIYFIYFILVIIFYVDLAIFIMSLSKATIRYIYKSFRLLNKVNKSNNLGIKKLHHFWWIFSRKDCFDLSLKTYNKTYPVKIVRTFRSGIQYIIPSMDEWYKRKYIALPFKRTELICSKPKRIKEKLNSIPNLNKDDITILLFYPRPFSLKDSLENSVKNKAKSGLFFNNKNTKSNELSAGVVYKNTLIADGEMFIRLLNSTDAHINEYIASVIKHKAAHF